MYAFDKSVRTAYLDDSRGFFNGNSVFLLPLGYENSTYQIELIYPKSWYIATTLTQVNNNIYTSTTYEDLIDHPVEMANFKRIDFEVDGMPHAIVISGKHTTNSQN